MPRHKIIEGQLTLQGFNAHQAAVLPQAAGGVAVDIALRANYLKSAAINHGKANQRIGFGDAVDIEPHSREIWGRYKGSTRKRVNRALDNVSGFETQAKKDFWIATGLGAVVAHKELGISKDEAQALARVWFRDFNRKSQGGKSSREAAKAKSKFLGGFNKQLTAQKRLKSKESKAA